AQGGLGLGGIAIPVGDPQAPAAEAAPAAQPRVTRSEARTLEAAAERAPARRSNTDCDEEEVRPRPVSIPQPAYTDAARGQEIEGRVRLRVEVDAEGGVSSVAVVAGLGHGLDESAVASMRTARFEPATRCGRPVASSFTISVRFTL
ncbi:MAG: energy transducer TonB, partial [Sandaracinaceae bacterium]|nr:energy transducer TonB [Sandaracinaceae bacterium]